MFYQNKNKSVMNCKAQTRKRVLICKLGSAFKLDSPSQNEEQRRRPIRFYVYITILNFKGYVRSEKDVSITKRIIIYSQLPMAPVLFS